MAKLDKQNTSGISVNNRLKYYNLYEKVKGNSNNKSHISSKYTVYILVGANIAFWLINTLIFKLSLGGCSIFAVLLIIFSGFQCYALNNHFSSSNKTDNKELSMSFELCNIKDIKSFESNVETLRNKYKAVQMVYGSSYRVSLDEYVDTMLTKYYNPESLLPSGQLNDAFNDVKASLKGE